MKRISDRLINLGLVLLSFGLCWIILEIICRVAFRTGAKDYQINNPYDYIEKIATALPYSHYGCYQERVPLEFDHLSYYDSTNGIVHFYSNQLKIYSILLITIFCLILSDALIFQRYPLIMPLAKI